VAEAHPELMAAVAWAPVERDDLGKHLDRLTRHTLVRGIRRNAQDEPDAMFCARPEFVRGARSLGERGLVCDIGLRHWHLPGVIALARACPGTTFVLNHLGKPDVERGTLDPWREHMSALADLEQVHVKLSVVVHGPDDCGWSEAAVAPFVRHVLDRFGPERVLWGSNWPVATLLSEYGAWLATARALTGHLSEPQREAVFHGTAARIYGVNG
jgi:L-fuconolactonase